jgi:hypothetical protein
MGSRPERGVVAATPCQASGGVHAPAAGQPSTGLAPTSSVVREARRRNSSRPMSSITVKAAGTTTRLSTVEVMRPPITAMAIGARKLESAA